MWQAIKSMGAWGGAWNHAGDRRRRPDAGTLAARYDRAAAHWQTRYIDRLGFQRAYTQFCERLIETHPLPSAQARVLDCGIGTAAFSTAFTAATGIRNIYGMDVSSGMLHQSGSRLEAQGVRGQLCRADIHRLPFANDTFDIVLSAHMLEHLSAPWIGIREMARVLRPGGVLAIIATRNNPVDVFSRLYWRYAPLSAAALRDWLAWSGMSRPRRYRLGLPVRGPYWLSRGVVATKSQYSWRDWSGGNTANAVAA